jgi:type IV secretion system protein TrbI
LDLKKDIMTFWQRNKKSHSSQTPSTISMKDGNHGTIFGFKRNLVIGAGVVLFLAFVISYICASDNTAQDAKPKVTKQEAADARIQTTGALSDANDYSDLMRSDHKFKTNGTAKGNTGTANANSMANAGAGTSATVTQSPRQFPASSYSQPYPYLPTAANSVPQMASIPSASVATQTEDSGGKADSLKDRFKAAIAFALGNDASAVKDAVSAQPSGASSSMPTVQTVSYTVPNGNGLQAGTLIPAVLCSGINTDVGGQVVAQVESDVYDSVYGSTLLIPAGSRLLGSYDSGKASTDGRVSVTFSTILLPDGGSYALGDGCFIAVDGAGYNGIVGQVNNHTGRMLTAGAVSTALSAIAGVAGGNTSTSSTTYSAGQLAAQGAMSNLLNSASSLFQKGMNTQATVTVSPGYEFNIYVTKPISLGMNS